MRSWVFSFLHQVLSHSETEAGLSGSVSSGIFAETTENGFGTVCFPGFQGSLCSQGDGTRKGDRQCLWGQVRWQQTVGDSKFSGEGLGARGFVGRGS